MFRAKVFMACCAVMLVGGMGLLKIFPFHKEANISESNVMETAFACWCKARSTIRVADSLSL
eukprot:scaffold34646_cov173-Amphora_coffeaeformis.AAC.36